MNLAIAIRVSLIALAASVYCGQVAAAPDAAVTQEQLNQAIADRDRVIIDLLRRIEKLESRGGDDPAPVTAPGASGSDGELSRPESETERRPGDLQVDELAAQRALERGLVSDGSLLLAAGQTELVPGFTYSRLESDAATAIRIGPDVFVGNVDSSQNRLDIGLLFRAGLSRSMQFEAAIPYRYLDSTDTFDVDGGIASSRDRHGSGLGDLRLGLAGVLLDEEDDSPGLIGRVTWDSSSGDERDGGLALGFGFDELEISLTALLTRDPMVFFGSVSYRNTREHDDLEPGDSYEIGLGTAVAISPDTSLTLSFDQRYTDELEFDGEAIDGSERLSGSFGLGVSVVLGPRASMQTNLGIGLTDDAADYSLEIFFPIRF